MTLRRRAMAGLVVASLSLTVGGCSSDGSVDSDLRLELQRSVASVESQTLHWS